jgi:CRP/FNR family transcriptional regulator, anaerobic regulatory protein
MSRALFFGYEPARRCPTGSQYTSMMTAARFMLHRPELVDSLLRGDEKLSDLMQGAVHSLPAGRVMIQADSEHDYVYRLRSGWACRNRAIADGRDQFILIFLPGDLFAVKSLFVTRHPDRVQTLSNAVVERVHYAQLQAAYSRDVDIANRCLWQVIEEERRLHSWVFGLGQGSAEERLALLLIDLRGRLILSGNLPEGALTFEFPLTQVQVSEHLGITPVHTNRMIRSFRERGIAVFRNGEASIQNFTELRRLAEPLMDGYERTTAQYNFPGTEVT